MIRERESIDHPEIDIELARNYSGEAIEAGSVVCLDISSGGNGVRAVKPSSAGFGMVFGIADEDAPDGEVFRVQRRGWRQAGAKVINDVITPIAAGDILIPVDGQWYLARSGASDGKSGFIIAAEGRIPSNPATVVLTKVFIR